MLSDSVHKWNKGCEPVIPLSGLYIHGWQPSWGMSELVVLWQRTSMVLFSNRHLGI